MILPWGDQVDIYSGVGVKQGSTESPGLFSRLMDDILVDVSSMQGDTLFDDLGDSTAAFMDDVLGWFPNAAALDLFFRALLPRLRAFGLTLQPSKCQMMLVGGIADPEVVLDGVPLVPLPRDEPLYVMHLPVHPSVSDMDLTVFLLDKARSKFYSLLPVLSSKASLHWRLQLFDKTVLSAIKWVLGILCPAPKIQQCVNHFQFRCVRTMMGLKRRSQEAWIEFELRTIRLSRLMVWRHLKKRWGDVALELHWGYTGHRARQPRGGSVTSNLTWHRTLSWWTLEQSRTGGARHPRHYPAVMNSERLLSRAAGSMHWREVACRRDVWRDKKAVWLRNMSVAWSSCRQYAVQQ